MRKRGSFLIIVLVILSPLALTETQVTNGQTAPTRTDAPAHHPRTALRVSSVCARCVRAHMDFLASDALHGRGSGTPDELVAATYIASALEQYGVEPAGDEGGYIQHASVIRRKLSRPPQVKFTTNAASPQEVTWTHGKEMLVLYLGSTTFSGPLQKIDLASGEDQKVQPGAVVFLKAQNESQGRCAAFQLASQGAAGVLVPESKQIRSRWEIMGNKLPDLPAQLAGGTESDMAEEFAMLAVSNDAAAVLGHLPDGTTIRMEAPISTPANSSTWNVIGRIRGADPTREQKAVLLSAHLDHLGIGPPVKGDDIYNGADDDASGTTAVLELARVLAAGPKPRRTVIFALFGSEEAGGLGSSYFREHPPIPLHDIAANLEFEMIGRPDPTVPHDTLWLTGWQRSNLGPELAAHGANLVADPHSEQGFFSRSDNYVLAKKGVVAQTVSSYGLHRDYHQPSDDLSHIDFQHMDAAIGSMIKPVLWLVNSNFTPHWNQGGQP